MAEGRARLWGLVAEANGEIVGFGQLTRWGWRGEICNLIVRENWRGKGIGTALIRQLIEIARQLGLREVEIGGAEANPRALALYRRLGFEDERRVLLDLGEGNEPVIYLLMRLNRVVAA